ncbi:MAG: DUF2892 domain-containing protein [Parachlamydiales bacterium]|jgi:hypothetical protein
MTPNIGTPDRLIRLTIAIVLFVLAWYYASWILLAFAVFTLYEAIAGWCLFFQLIGKNSCDLKR